MEYLLQLKFLSFSWLNAIILNSLKILCFQDNIPDAMCNRTSKQDPFFLFHFGS
jgi:hypothetical protein